MADALTFDGIDDLMKAVDAFPSKFNQAAQAVAESCATRIQTRAQAILQSKVRGNPVDITVTVDAPNRQVLVSADFAQGQPTKAHLWFEYGTVDRVQKSGRRTGQIHAVHYMRDAIAAERTSFPGGMDAALTATLRALFT